MAEQQAGKLRRMHMTAVRKPERNRDEPGDHRYQPRDQKRDRFRRHHIRDRRRRLHEQCPRTGRPLMREHPDHDERQQQHRDEIVGAERRHEDPVERIHSARDHRAGGAQLGIRRDRRNEFVPHQQSREDEQQRERRRDCELAQLFANQRPGVATRHASFRVT